MRFRIVNPTTQLEALNSSGNLTFLYDSTWFIYINLENKKDS